MDALFKKTKNLADEYMAMETRQAKEAGAIGFMARLMVLATIPHRDPKSNEFSRKNGNFKLHISIPKNMGLSLPFGSIPRLLLCWMTTEATRTKSKHLVLGKSLSEFMNKLAYNGKTGGKNGSITQLRSQMQRLFASSISCTYDDGKGWGIENIKIVRKGKIWWDPLHPDQNSLWQSELILDADFYDEIIEHPVPVDMRAIKVLKDSPMCLDIYFWLTYRMSYLPKKCQIPWPVLKTQFGLMSDN